MLKERVREKPKQICVPLTLNNNHFCPNISKVVQKHWNLVTINKSKKKYLIVNDTAFKRCNNLKVLIGSNKIEKN